MSNTRVTPIAFATIVTLIVLIITSPLSALDNTNLVGKWEGKVSFTNVQPVIQLDIQSDKSGKLTGTMDLPMQKSENLPIENFKVNGETVTFDLINNNTTASFEGKFLSAERKIEGDFIQAGYAYPFHLEARDEFTYKGE